MRRRQLPRLILCQLLVLVCLPAAAIAQPAVALRVIGAAPNHLALGLADIAMLPHLTVRVTTEKGVATEYEGVPIAEILRKAGAPLGKDLRGPYLALGVVAGAPDGYRVLFSLAEIDPAFSSRVIILADRRDGKQLDNHEGPLRIIVPGDQRGARWIRAVNTLKLTPTL